MALERPALAGKFMTLNPPFAVAPHLPLGLAPKGFLGRIHSICVQDSQGQLPAAEMERRLIELGFIEGAQVQILHEGLFGRDPIAVRINGATVALRRREAMAILTE
jgi:ferrous iron transport protein A